MGDGSVSSKFPAADIDGELNPGSKTEFEIDSVSSLISQGHKEVVFPKNTEKKACCGEEKNCRCANEGVIKTLQKKSLMISAVIMAIAAAAFVVTKNVQDRSK